MAGWPGWLADISQNDMAPAAMMMRLGFLFGLGLAPSFGAPASVVPGSTGLRVQYFNNSVLLGRACDGGVESAAANLSIDAAALSAKCGGDLSPSMFSARFHGHLNLPPGQYQMKTQMNGALRFWVHGWKLVDDFTAPSPSREVVGKYNFTVVAGATYPVRLDVLFTALPAIVHISYREVGRAAEWVLLPPSALSPTVSSQEQQRQALQMGLSGGWNTWHRASATAHVHLPSAFGFDMTILDPAMNTSFTKGIVDRCGQSTPCLVRPGVHTFNGSFTHFDQVSQQEDPHCLIFSHAWPHVFCLWTSTCRRIMAEAVPATLAAGSRGPERRREVCARCRF